MIYNEDCLEGMKRLEDNSVDMCLTDLPFNLTDCAWDKAAINLSEFWAQIKRILKPKCSAVLFASGKFAYKLIASNYDWYKYKWIWGKNSPTMFVHAKNAPMRKFEEILVFSDGAINHASCTTRRMKYNPQGVMPCEFAHSINKHSEVSLRGGKLKGNWERRGKRKLGSTVGERPSHVDCYIQEQTGYPMDVIEFDTVPNQQRDHPTQKPVDLLEYLIKTYTNEGEMVLDATMGSGSTGVAAINTGRNFIGFELEKTFFEIAQKRIDAALAEKRQELF